MISKPYSQMTPSERVADRIIKNRQIEANVSASKQVHQVAEQFSRGFRAVVGEGNAPTLIRALYR